MKLSILFALPLLACPTPGQLPEEAGEALASELEALVEEGRVVGVQVLLQSRGELVFERCAGLADRESGRPLEPDAIHRFYSMTKPITCVAALSFLDEGRFELDDPVARYLPELAELKVSAGGESKELVDSTPMRVRDLFQHTSGWSYSTPLYFTPGRLKERVEALARVPLEFQPGSAWRYGISHDVLGRLVEVLADAPLDEVFQERIFEPLGMRDTGFQLSREQAKRLASVYTRASGSLEAVATSAAWRPTKEPPFFSGGGGLFSTADDYMRFLSMLRGGGALDGERVLSKKSVALMTQDHIGVLPRSMLLGPKGYGLGVSVVPERLNSAQRPFALMRTPGLSPGTYSWAGMAGTFFWIDPERDWIGIFLIQTENDFEPGQRFLERLLKEL